MKLFSVIAAFSQRVAVLEYVDVSVSSKFYSLCFSIVVCPIHSSTFL